VSREKNPIRLGWLLAPVLALNLFALTSLCYASPPDQTWIAGLYDDSDHDDVVLQLANTSAVPPIAPPYLLAPAAIRETEPASARAVPSPLHRTALLDRSPPLA
jgi:hypothetical protein